MTHTSTSPTVSRRAALAAGAVAAVGSLTNAGQAQASPSSSRPSTSSSGAVDTTIWREHGTPLVKPWAHGPLTGLGVAVKDLFEIEGHKVGAGNVEWLAEAKPSQETAAAVAKLLGAGARVNGIAETDEFAYSLAGTNGHYGTPPNPAAPDRITGGSTSGPASAVAMRQADIGLGTDTGGSIRIPSSYCGLYGLRPTHGAVPTGGLLPLAPSFDTVGFITRDPRTLRRAGEVLLPPSNHRVPGRVVMAESLLGIADDDVAAAVEAALGRWAKVRSLPKVERISFDASVLPQWVKDFQTQQGYEAWVANGAWISKHWDSLNPDIRSRFETASTYTRAQYDAAVAAVDSHRATVEALLGDAVLVLPSASSIAPTREAAGLGGSVIETARAKTFQLTCIAGSSRRPGLGMPVQDAGKPPVGMCLVGARGRDHVLLGLAERLQKAGVTR